MDLPGRLFRPESELDGVNFFRSARPALVLFCQACARSVRFEGYPPTPAETLAGRGFCKTACTILMSKGLKVKLLITKDLALASQAPRTPSRSAMTRVHESRRKVGRHNGAVKHFGKTSGERSSVFGIERYLY